MATPEPRTLATLNACSRETFVAALGEVFEHASWVTEAALSRRPFATVAAVHQAMVETLRQLDAEHRTRASILRQLEQRHGNALDHHNLSRTLTHQLDLNFLASASALRASRPTSAPTATNR
jgi:2-oxo-4-hydroxy-4-carboxy--5-ureidoimidazoline (OHCU) decarboxylase